MEEGKLESLYNTFSNSEEMFAMLCNSASRTAIIVPYSLYPTHGMDGRVAVLLPC